MAHDRTHFGGLAGQVLRGVLSRATLLTGMTLASCLFLAARGLTTLERVEWFPAAALLLVSLAMAFHAVRGAHASGFAARPGLLRTADVGLRTALGSTIWLAPWMLWGAALGARSPMLETVGMPSAVAAALWIFATLMVTPALLIAAAHSRNWFDVVSPTHWGSQFSGRGADLMTVYTVQTGGLVLVTGMALPLVTATLRYHPTAGLAVAAGSVCVVAGSWTTLAGRLCGTVHASAPVEAAAAEAPRFDEGLAFAGPALDTELNRDIQETFESPEAEPEPAHAEEPEAPAQEPAPTESEPAEPAAAAEPKSKPLRPDREAARIRRYAAPKQPVAFDVPKVDENKRRTPLLDAEARVEESMKRFRLDPSHTLSKLAELNQNFAPNAHVLQALAICLHRTGHPEQAFKAARQAFPLCFEQGHVSLAAAMFYELRANLQRFDLKQEQVQAIAEVLHKADELAAAAKAYSLVIHTNPKEFVAVKGLLDVADRILYDKKKPPAALKVYMFLLDNCADPAMIELVRDGINNCRAAEEETQPVPS